MAQTVHLTINIGGTDLVGESTQDTDGKKGTIECFYFESGLQSPHDPAKGYAVGQRQSRPIKVRKRIDKTSPLLARALVGNQSLTARFGFFRPTTGDDPNDEEFFVITIGKPTQSLVEGEKPNAHISAVRLVVPDTMGDQMQELREAYEEVEFVYDSISWDYLRNKMAESAYACSWSQGANK